MGVGRGLGGGVREERGRRQLEFGPGSLKGRLGIGPLAGQDRW
jgi:hypothetical protein